VITPIFDVDLNFTSQNTEELADLLKNIRQNTHDSFREAGLVDQKGDDLFFFELQSTTT
jgi:hypothetical protein